MRRRIKVSYCQDEIGAPFMVYSIAYYLELYNVINGFLISCIYQQKVKLVVCV